MGDTKLRFTAKKQKNEQAGQVGVAKEEDFSLHNTRSTTA
jgi:hypothetical protein